MLQTAGSLVAIVALAALAWWMRLGPRAPLNHADAVRAIAGEVDDGFTPVDIACDEKGTGALVRDGEGRIMLIKAHGNRFAGRLLTAQARAALTGESDTFNIAIDCGEARFGRVFLTIPDPAAWADAINRLGSPGDA
ncbi:hypothetical protein [Erythrobacter sp.]|uniref:hypothetical protein n=1 Tax=Erythrobacter sp. TaxID=1042 RepID=UPI00260051B2|nr:hypothetical protein [Erythrobacter sp.]